MNISAEQLAMVAERLPGIAGIQQLGESFAIWRIGQHDPRSERWSAWDLLGACLNRAAEMGHAAIILWDTDPAPHAWLVAFGHGADPDTDGAVSSEGLLKAAILAFIQLPASQGDA